MGLGVHFGTHHTHYMLTDVAFMLIHALQIKYLSANKFQNKTIAKIDALPWISSF
jgi:hypothetical protein